MKNSLFILLLLILTSFTYDSRVIIIKNNCIAVIAERSYSFKDDEVILLDSTTVELQKAIDTLKTKKNEKYKKKNNK
jgi:hypothetical protein